MRIILYQPQIPQNTGNIVRTCAVTGSELTLVTPLGFSINDRWLKRAGLGYLNNVKIETVDDFEEYLNEAPANVYFYSSKATKKYTDVQYTASDWLVFGSETDGLPPWISERYSNNMLTLPMKEGARCLNLATTAGIVVYEAWRQLDFSV